MTESDTNSLGNYSNPYDDPLFLSNSYYPGIQLLNTVKGMVLALSSKNKHGFLDETTTMPDSTSSKLQQWRRSDTMVRCWILNSMLDSMKEGFMTVKTAKLLWTEIRERYGKSNGSLNMSIAEYFSKLKKYWDDIEEIESYPDCSYGTLTKFSKEKCESQKLVNNVFNVPQDASAFVVDKMMGGNYWRKDQKRPKTNKRWCDYCKKSGHVRDRCFRLHPDLRTKFEASKFGAQMSSAHMVENKDIQMFECEHPLEMPSAHAAIANEHSVHVDPALVNALYKQMVQLFQSNSDGFSNMASGQMNSAGTTLASTWIIDSGATDHMTPQKLLFEKIKNLDKPLVTQIRNVRIHPEIMLYDVLYVPTFKHSLLSVSKLLIENGMSIRFDIDKLAVEVQSEKGSFIENSNNVTVSETVEKLDLMHSRLGHTSLSKMQHVKQISCGSLQNYFCDTCVMAKMHKIPFEINLWGPYKVPSLIDNSRATWTYLLKDKLQVPSIIISFFAQVQTQFGASIKTLMRVIYQKSAPGTPQHNGRVERKHRHLVETKFWGDCLLGATHH
ncbi:hypothetical protein RND81_05G223200 [Saponaria officinalis]|uniref:GAG-pre-integrase domain-containing protein n=1 Tax=Saponaria officinalis TaxID=3572 RepID=A0AAW1L309_SAPOF